MLKLILKSTVTGREWTYEHLSDEGKSGLGWQIRLTTDSSPPRGEYRYSLYDEESGQCLADGLAMNGENPKPKAQPYKGTTDKPVQYNG